MIWVGPYTSSMTCCVYRTCVLSLFILQVAGHRCEQFQRLLPLKGLLTATDGSIEAGHIRSDRFLNGRRRDRRRLHVRQEGTGLVDYSDFSAIVLFYGS